MNDPSNICLSCGLCCDGTLIGFVELEREEMPALRKLMDIEDESGHGFFLHPCDSFCNGCTIYADRPKKCDAFKCQLLTAVEQKDLAFDSAVEIIEVVKQKKKAIESKLEQLNLTLLSPSFYFKMVELKNLFEKSAITESQTELMDELNLLESLLLKEFGVSLN